MNPTEFFLYGPSLRGVMTTSENKLNSFPGLDKKKDESEVVSATKTEITESVRIRKKNQKACLV